MKRSKQSTVLAPTKTILHAAGVLDDAIGRYMKAIGMLKDTRIYESHSEAITLGWVLARHVESICALAQRDLVMLPSANVIARTTLETAGKILWIMNPEIAMDREARWLAQLAGEENYYHEMAKFLNEQGLDGSEHTRLEETFSHFRLGVEAKLSAEIRRLKKMPNFREILKDLGREELYGFYKRLSQFTHGTSVASGLYKKNLGTIKEIGEFIYPEQWNLPLSIAWYCIVHVGLELITKLNGAAGSFLSDAFIKRGHEAMNKI